MRIVVFCVSLLFIAFSSPKLYAEEDANTEKVALLRRLSKLSANDTLRLEVLNDLTRIAGDTNVEKYYIGKLLKESKEMNNPKYMCKAYLSYMVLASNSFNKEEVDYWMGYLEPLARKHKLYRELFWAKRCVIDMLMLTEQYEQEEKAANEMLREAEQLNNDIGRIGAYQCLANVYRITYRHQEAAEALEKAYLLALKGNEHLNVEILNSLIAINKALGDKPQWLKWTQMQDEFLNRLIRERPNDLLRYKGWLMMMYVSYLSYYTEVNNMDQAEKYLRLSEKYNEGESAFQTYYHEARYFYFRERALYDDALVEVNKLMGIFKGVSPVSYTAYYFWKAKLLHLMEREDDALVIYKEAFATSDSIQISIMNKQTAQLRKEYNTDQLLLKKERIDRDIKTIFLLTMAVIIVILIVFIAHTIRVRKSLRLSEKEMRKAMEEMEQANIAKERFLSTINTAISVPLNKVVDNSMRLVSGEEIDAEEQKHISAVINTTSPKLMELINNILDLSRLEAGMMKYRDEEMDLLMVIRNLMDTMSDSQRQQISVCVPEEETLQARIDVVRLQEVLNNLLLTSPGKLTLTVSKLAEQNEIQICVTGSLLCAFPQTQEVAIANEVNRLLIEHFEGRYELRLEETPAAVCFFIPLLRV